MIIISSRKFRDNQNEYFKMALEEEVILKTLHFGNFRLVPIVAETKVTGRKKRTKKVPEGAIYIPDSIISTNPIINNVENQDSPAAENLTKKTNDSPVTELVVSTPAAKINDEVKPETVTTEPEKAVAKIENPEPTEQVITNSEISSDPVSAPSTVEDPVKVDPQIEEPKVTLQVKQEPEYSETTSSENSKFESTPTVEQKLQNFEKRVEELKKPVVIEEVTEEPIKENETPAVAVKPVQPAPEGEQTVNESWKPGKVFVDPSLLSLEEVRIQEGFDEGAQKKGFFSKLFKRK